MLTACSGGADSDAKPANSPSSSQATKQKKQVTAAQRLTQLAITQADVSGYKVKEPDTKEVYAKTQDDLTVNKADCAPLAYALNQLPLGSPEASLKREASDSNFMITYITLATYPQGKAEETMKGLSKAVASCKGGFSAKSKRGSTTTYTSAALETAPAGGDESLATAATFSFRGYTHTLRTQTFRFGDTIANYFTLDSGAFISSRPGNAKIPTSVVKAQNSKLG
jgi:hypothetical protein